MTPEGKAQLISDEGMRLQVYWDNTGETIKADNENGRPTIGIGRNVGSSGPGITEDEAVFLFSNDILKREAKIINALPWIVNIPPVWRDVLTMVDFNTGNVLLWEATLAAMKAGESDEAAEALMSSKAAEQLPARYGRMAAAIRNKSWTGTVET
jgi:GH24 family phage-related lysozyme (muramidase)